MGYTKGKFVDRLFRGPSFSLNHHVLVDVSCLCFQAQWIFWIPVQLLNFRFVPVRHQLNVVLLTSVVWTALLSAWYPPETDEPNDTQEESDVNE